MKDTTRDKLARIKANRAPTMNTEAPPPADGAMSILTLLRGMAPMFNASTMRSDALRTLFDPRRDIDEECGYPKTITDEQYRRMYDRGLGRRVVNIYPEESWKEFPEIYEEPDPEVNTEFEKKLEEIDKHLHLLQFMQRADELSGIGHYGIILWGFGDGKTLDQPVAGFERWAESTGKIDKAPVAPAEMPLLFIRVLDESLVQIADYETDVTNPRYGLPRSYNITLADPRNGEGKAIATPPGSITHTRVHWSRITHITDNRKTSEVLGTPRQEPVWDRLYDLRKILSGSGEMFWRGGFPGLSLETHPGLEGAEMDEDAMRQMMNDYMNGLQRYLATTGMSAKSLAPQIADPSQSFDVQIKAICIIMGVPYRVFMGIEEGVVSGDQATNAWEGRIANRQARYITPMIINPVIQRLIDAGVLPPTAEPLGWCVEWPDTTAPSETEKATIAGQKTEAFAKYVQGGVDQLIPPLEYLTLICGIDEEVATQIMEAAVDHIETVAEQQMAQQEQEIAGHAAKTEVDTQAAIAGHEAKTAIDTQAAIAIKKTPEPPKPAAPGAKPKPKGAKK